MHAMFGTALTFHIVSIFAEAGRDSVEAFGYFLPAAVFSTVVNLLASSVVDRHPLKPYLLLMLVCFIMGAIGLLKLQHDWGFWLLAMGFGAGGGLWGVTSNLAFIRFFGPLHLGEITGLNASLTVFASAIGPAAFSLGLDYFGSYNAAVWVSLGLLVILLMAALWVRQEEVIHAKHD
jgi:cyanate permease